MDFKCGLATEAALATLWTFQNHTKAWLDILMTKYNIKERPFLDRIFWDRLQNVLAWWYSSFQTETSRGRFLNAFYNCFPLVPNVPCDRQRWIQVASVGKRLRRGPGTRGCSHETYLSGVVEELHTHGQPAEYLLKTLYLAEICG